MFLSTVAFTALVGVLWEVCEYAIDGMAGKNMQRFNNSVTNEPFVGRIALRDTMIDLMMDTLGGLLAGLYFAFANIKGIPLYKFLELKYVKADSNISYQEDIVDNDNLKTAKAEKKALKLEQQNLKRKNKIEKRQYNALYKQEKSKIKKDKKLSKKQNKTASINKNNKEEKPSDDSSQNTNNQ